ncbi:RFX DNA-binding domain-containing protein [Circinella umbellata]|nr:RFX DNA-binding domain-containing protein [Circinella umbellata]
MPPAQNRSLPAEHETTIQWLRDNYRECLTTQMDNSNITGIPRASVYERYQQQYSQQRTAVKPPVNSATFGKLVRSVFPKIKARRLGNRGQSKYYYCGITQIDPPSSTTTPTNSRVSAADGSTWDNNEMMNVDTDNEASKQQPVDGQQVQQQDEPQNVINDVIPPLSMPSMISYLCDNTATDISSIYYQHCQQQLQLINTDQNVRESIITFYENIPHDMHELLQSDANMIEVVCSWDCIFYDAIISFYYPTIDTEVDISIIPSRLSEWSSTLLDIIPIALRQRYPQELVDNKLAVAKIFSTKLERIIHLNFLAQASNQVLLEHGDSMLEMWRQIDLHNISDRAGWIIGNKNTVIGEQFDQIIVLLQKSSSAEEETHQPPRNRIRNWIEWIDSVMNLHVLKGQGYDHIKQIGRIWSIYTSVARREMELQKKKNNETHSTIIDYFERVWVFTNDYIQYLIEQEIARRNAELLFVYDDEDDNSQRGTPLPSYSINSGPSPDYMSTTTTTPQTITTTPQRMMSFINENS